MEPLRRLVTWLAPADGPLQVLKQDIRDLEDQVPRLNESLFMIKTQVTLLEKEVARLRATEGELQEKVRAADTESKAACYTETLTELRRQVEHEERRLAEVRGTFELAQEAKRAFMDRKEARIHAAKAALAAQRDAEWNRKLARDLVAFDAGDDDPHVELVRGLEAERLASEQDLQAVLDRLAGRPRHVEALLSKVGALRQQLVALEAQAATLEQELRRP